MQLCVCSRHFKNMNTNQNENGNSQIPDVPELVLEDGLSAEEVQERITEHNQAVADYKEKIGSTNKQLFERVKKAEGFEFKDGKWVKPNKSSEETEQKPNNSETQISQTDFYALIKADVPEEDFSDVVDYAKLKNISIAEALKSTIVKSVLAEKKEVRNVAEGTHTGGGTRGSGKMSDEKLMENASKGIMPESDEDMSRLVSLRRGKK